MESGSDNQLAKRKSKLQFTYSIETYSTQSILKQISAIDKEFEEFLTQYLASIHPSLNNIEDASSLIGVATAVKQIPEYCNKRQLRAIQEKVCAVATCTIIFDYYPYLYCRDGICSPVSEENKEGSDNFSLSFISAEKVEFELLMGVENFFNIRKSTLENNSNKTAVDLTFLGPQPVETHLQLSLVRPKEGSFAEEMDGAQRNWFEQRILDFVQDAGTKEILPSSVYPRIVSVTSQSFVSRPAQDGLGPTAMGRSVTEENAWHWINPQSPLVVSFIVSSHYDPPPYANVTEEMFNTFALGASQPLSSTMSILSYLQNQPLGSLIYSNITSTPRSAIQFFKSLERIDFHISAKTTAARSRAMDYFSVGVVVACTLIAVLCFTKFTIRSFKRDTQLPGEEKVSSGLSEAKNEGSGFKQPKSLRKRGPKLSLDTETLSKESEPLSPNKEEMLSPTNKKTSPPQSLLDNFSPSYLRKSIQSRGPKTSSSKKQEFQASGSRKHEPNSVTRNAISQTPTATIWNMNRDLEEETDRSSSSPAIPDIKKALSEKTD